MGFQLNLIFLLIYCAQKICGYDMVFYFNLKHHPLIVSALKEKEENFYSLVRQPAINHEEYLEFRLPLKFQTAHRLVSACSPENQDDANSDKMLLYENPTTENMNKYCKNPLIPSITLTDPLVECGYDQRGILYHFGYWVTVNNSIKEVKGKSTEFVTIYKICYDKGKENVIFSLHALEPGQNSNNKTPAEEFNELKFFTTFGKDHESKILPKEPGKHLRQFVPYDDMIPIAWKISTLFDINTYKVSEKIKIELDKVDEFIRSYATKASTSFEIYSGVTSDEALSSPTDLLWYWKIIRKKDEGIIIMIGEDSDSQSCESPCIMSNEDLCKQSNFEILINTKTCLYCCKVDDLIEELEVIVGGKDSPEKVLNVPYLLKFKDLNDEENFSIKYPKFESFKV